MDSRFKLRIIALLSFALFLILPMVSQAQEVPDALSLDSAIQIGLKNNPEIKSSWQKVKASKGRLWSAIAPPPTDFSVSRDAIPKGEGFQHYSDQTMEVSQSMEFPTNYFLRGSKQSIEEEIAENEFGLARVSVVSKVKTAYFKTYAAQEQLKVAKDNLSIAEDFVKKAEIRHKVGEGTGLEKLTAKVQYAEAVNNLEVRKNRLALSFIDLNFAMGSGKNEAREYRLTDTLGATSLNLSQDQLMDMAISASPRHKISRLRVRTASVDKALAWSSFLPGLSAAYSKQEIAGDKGYYGVSLGVSVPLWFLLDQQGKIREASANLSAARDEMQTADNAVYAELRNAYAEFKNEERQIQSYKADIIPQAEEIYRAASKSYEAGEITYLEFLQARQTLVGARSGYVDALLAYHFSIISIEEAVGSRLN